MEENEFYTQLARRYAENLLREEEYEVFFHALQEGVLKPHLVGAMTEAGAGTADPLTEALARETADLPIRENAETPIAVHALDVPRIHRLPRWTRAAAAAAVTALLLGGAWLWLGRPAPPQGGAAAIQKPIPPASNKAILTLSGGKTIVLDSSANGVIASQGTTQVQKTANGRLLYEAGSAPPGVGGRVLYNTLSTSRGGQYQLVLPDGTKVWLNAASSIIYPTAFTGKDRPVTVTGEAYFDVAKNAAQPFRVNVSGAEIEVLGTSFNITAYADDPEPEIRATLIRGVIRVLRGNNAVLLHPGQQARMTTDNQPIRLIPDADTAAAIAWITGFFQFRELSVPAVMRQISRWYDVDVVYDAPAASLTARHFGGRISRRQNLSDLLPILEANQIHFRLEGTTIHILP